jgi:chemotaxis protein histidine kinase CheA
MEKAKILFVEDEAIITMEIENQLERLEYELTSIVDTDKKLILISIRGLLMDENQEIINNLIDESTEQLDSIIGDVLNLEEERDIEITNKIFRTFHSIKRNISMLGFLKCSTFAHKVEDVVSLIREGKLVPDSRVVDILLKSLDTLRTLFEDIRDRGSDDRDVSEILNLLHFELSDIQKKEPVKPNHLKKY